MIYIMYTTQSYVFLSYLVLPSNLYRGFYVLKARKSAKGDVSLCSQGVKKNVWKCDQINKDFTETDLRMQNQAMM